ncbi:MULTISPECIES: tetratricopeptide repeat protein [Streptomyces]|uniref:Tetratricopeptide repeat protein n=1 Tax=Streptomyces fradiae ATCC 10745 = DSM 40063 TaxID=1319510 RepID=A0A1Y2P4A5_STRFR|nr:MULTISPECIES: hypothetical protein [Streptomyces]KAF0651679.1 hypothetical protein K701_01735 [Streptomyces fradiae ATCC 10745 = DSM 40063]OSY54069.1 hypothetical protein BG846_00265 [Streptomyces fradiae ATCC 10745 = DSM 40063]QEV11114.1 hypothetical protein CP974_02800 [Streptomyces fradiae ATCC 10745 = DSM 40063]
MDADDLDYRARTLTGCIPPGLVARLLELGHEREVEFQADRGEWFCALEWTRLLGNRGRHGQALEVLAPYVATNWWPAAQAQAELLESWDRAEEAIALSRLYAEAGDRLALVFFARLLARHGRSGEAFMLLRTGIQDWFLAECLVDVAAAADMDEEAAALLEARVQAALPACNDPDCDRLRMEPSNAIGLLATVRERQGRIEEAIALLHIREITSVNGRDQLADLLARHDRIIELRAYAASEFHGHAVQRLAEVLEERDDVEGAITAYRTFGATPSGMWHAAVPLSELLVRHGRSDEAIEMLRAFTQHNAEDWLVDALCTLYADHGRSREGLAHLDAIKARHDGKEDWDLFQMRLPLMADCGLLGEAIEQTRAHPEGDTWYAAWALSDLLDKAGRTEEADAVLAQHPTANSSLRAERLVDLGHIQDALRLLQQPISKPTTPACDGTYSTEPPF